MAEDVELLNTRALWEWGCGGSGDGVRPGGLGSALLDGREVARAVSAALERLSRAGDKGEPALLRRSAAFAGGCGVEEEPVTFCSMRRRRVLRRSGRGG
ncbi:MAG: hypothetical protein ACLSHC_13280 [Bilophila wadsworthia]